MVIWISVKAGGAGTFFNAPPTVHGSTRAWLWLANLTSVTGGFSTLAVNIPDFSRFSKNSGAQYWQLPCIPFLKVIVGIFGIISASASKEIYGTTLWSPLTIIAKWQGTPGGRAAAFFAGLVWLVAQISVNVTANSISFANDITTLAPRYFNIRRGVIFASIIGGWALCPWIIIASAAAFLSFMSAYAIFMAPMAGILFCDYWLVKKRKYDVPALYDPRGIYFYRYGTNWRALAVTVIVIVPLLPGLIWKVAPKHVHIAVGLQHLFSFNWLYGFVLSVTLYYFLNVCFPDYDTLIPKVVHGLPQVVEGMEADVESDASTRSRDGHGSEKFLGIEKAREVGNTASI
ncbi:hypothetical protein Vi05172_g5488 [Venturia inaequalis]|nr:hypothetical protein Vi05172_g5488 [Venturia inaequalis]